VGGVGAIGALVGALITLLAVKLQRPQNIYSDGEGIGLDGGLRTLAHIPPLPIWAWLLAAIIGGLLGSMVAVAGLKTIQRLG
jgi:hypothetical protein